MLFNRPTTDRNHSGEQKVSFESPVLFSKCLRAKIYCNINVHFDPQGCQTLLLKESEPFLLSLGSWTKSQLDLNRYKLFGKERRRKKPWVTKDVLDLCDERRDLKKKRYEAEGAKEYREANRRVQKAVKKAKEDWIGAQCEEIETCLNKNNSKRAYQLVKDLTSEKQGRSSTIQDKSGKCLTEEKEILSRWTEYCSELYNYESCGDNAVLDCSQPPEEDLQPILREEVEIAVASLKKGKSAGVDNIPAELVQAGGETMIDVLTEICNRIWRTGEWPTPWTQSLIITLPKKGNLQLCQNYRTISLISHSSKVMLKVILNRLKPQAEEIIAEEQAGFRAGRSTTEQIFNLRILCEKYLQHQQNLYHVFIDFKKAFDRVWHAALWATMRKYNISANLVRTIEQLYDKATSADQMNGSIGEWFRTTVGVRQGCLLSPTLFNIFLERIMSDALEEHDGKVSIGGRNITNLRFADDIIGVGRGGARGGQAPPIILEGGPTYPLPPPIIHSPFPSIYM